MRVEYPVKVEEVVMAAQDCRDKEIKEEHVRQWKRHSYPKSEE